MQTNFINTLAEGAAMVDRVGRPNFHLMMVTVSRAMSTFLGAA